MRAPSDETAFRALYEAHYSRIASYCSRRVGHSHADDLAAEVFAVAWRRMSDLPEGEASLPWLYGVAFRVVSRHWRSSKRRRRLKARVGGIAAVGPDGPEALTVRHAEYRTMLDALDRLRPLDQEVLRLAVWEELPHAEIAAAIDSTEQAVRQRFRRAKRALADEFERIGGSLPPDAVAREGGVS